MNVHIQHVIKKMAQVDSNVERLIKKNKNYKVEVQHLVTEQDKQEAQSNHLEERLKAMEDLMEDQAMKIVGLEEEGLHLWGESCDYIWVWESRGSFDSRVC